MAGELWRAKAQVGKESSYGVAVAATRVIYGQNIGLTRERESRPHRFATGTRDNVRAHTLGAVQAGGSVEMPLSADEMLEFLLCGLQGAVTPTTPSGFTNGRQWQFRPSTALDSMTIEFDDGANVWEEYGVYVDEINFSGSVGGENMVTFTLFGRERVSSSLTGALTERTPTFIEGWETRLYIDAFGGTAGTTQVSNTLINWDITISNGLGRKYTADNTLAPSKITIGELTVTATLTFEADQSIVDTELTNWDDETNRLVRIEFGQNEAIDAGTNEVQTLTESGSITAGDYTISFKGQTTGAIAFNATAATVQAALEALGAIGPGNVAVGGGPVDTTPLTLTFQDQLGGLNMPAVTVDSTGLTGGTIGVTTTTPGAGSKRAVMIDLPGAWASADLSGSEEGTRTYQLELTGVYDTVNTHMAQILCHTSRTAAFA